MNIQNLVRQNIKHLVPYSSAKKEFGGASEIFLDANENNFGSPLEKNYNRYPDPLQREIKEKIAMMKRVKPTDIFIGNGSDEAIDLLFRIFCVPAEDNILICPPTYGMYEVSAEINDVKIKRVNLTQDFQLALAAIQNAIDEKTKLLFVCSPNNPTGNSYKRSEILNLVQNFGGICVVDEAYIDFSREKSLVEEIYNFPNIVVLQTFSKAWGLAGLRVGLAFANEGIIKLFNKVKPPYNVSQIAQEAILDAVENVETVQKNISAIIYERKKLVEKLCGISFVQKIYPTDANFVLLKMLDAEKIYRFLIDEKIVVRNRTNIELCENCLRITIGTSEENTKLLKSLEKYEKNFIY
jgi:histidinol-phosphate aminotransferase